MAVEPMALTARWMSGVGPWAAQTDGRAQVVEARRFKWCSAAAAALRTKTLLSRVDAGHRPIHNRLWNSATAPFTGNLPPPL